MGVGGSRGEGGKMSAASRIELSSVSAAASENWLSACAAVCDINSFVENVRQ